MPDVSVLSQGCDLRKVTKMGSEPGSPFGLKDKAPPPQPPGCIHVHVILEDLQTLHIPINKKLED